MYWADRQFSCRGIGGECDIRDVARDVADSVDVATTDAEAHRILDVRPGCSRADVRHGYYRKAFFSHPDRGGTNESFRQVHEAYMLLMSHKLVPNRLYWIMRLRYKQHAPSRKRLSEKQRQPQFRPSLAWNPVEGDMATPARAGVGGGTRSHATQHTPRGGEPVGGQSDFQWVKADCPNWPGTVSFSMGES